jgi:hypothetical protein
VSILFFGIYSTILPNWEESAVFFRNWCMTGECPSYTNFQVIFQDMMKTDDSNLIEHVFSIIIR